MLGEKKVLFTLITPELSTLDLFMGNTKLFYFFTNFILFLLWHFTINPNLFYYYFGNFIFSLKCFISKKSNLGYQGIHKPFRLFHKPETSILRVIHKP